MKQGRLAIVKKAQSRIIELEAEIQRMIESQIPVTQSTQSVQVFLDQDLNKNDVVILHRKGMLFDGDFCKEVIMKALVQSVQIRQDAIIKIKKAL